MKHLFIAISSCSLLLLAACSHPAAQTQPEEEEPAGPHGLNVELTNEICRSDCFRPVDRAIERWMRRNEIRGVSFALMRHDRLLYAHSYGWADQEDSVAAEVGQIYRIASASKLLTAVGIMRLKEAGKLSLNDRVFGPEGILNDSIYADFADKRIAQITVRQLMCHRGGFGLRNGDAMFHTARLVRDEGLNRAPTPQEVICHVLKQRLSFQPGSRSRYSNVGYLILSQVIEKITGETYEHYIQRDVLHPAGCHDMHIAGDYYEDRRPNEVKYYGHDMAEPAESFTGDNRPVTREYGGNHISGLQGAGGWAASAVELLRLVAAIDGDKQIADILTPADVHEMAHEHGRKEDDESLGWAFVKDRKRIRTGTMSGTIAYIEARPDGITYVLLTNTSHYRGAGFTQAVGRLIDPVLKQLDSLPDRDLFTPTTANTDQ